MIFMEAELDLVCGGLILFIIGIAIIFDGVNKYLTMRKVQNTPTSKIRSVAMGLAEVTGKSTSDVGAISPFSNEKCVYYEIKVEALIEDDDSSKWITLLKKDLDNVFKLDDETGIINVNPKGAEIHLDISKKAEGNIKKKLLVLGKVNNEILEFMEKLTPNERSAINRYSNHKIKVTERKIVEGEKIYVLGTVEPSTEKGDIRHIIKKGGEKIMFISNKEEKRIVSNLKMGVIYRLVGGLILSVASIILVFVKLDLF